MFSTLPRLAAPLAKRAFATRAFVAVRPQISSAVASPFAAQWQAQRAYSAAAGLSADSIKERIMEVLTSFEKVDPSKVSVTSSFTNDLGLDSLDAVEVVMAIEEEFSIEIPDEEADRITTVAEAIDYISKSAEAH